MNTELQMTSSSRINASQRCTSKLISRILDGTLKVVYAKPQAPFMIGPHKLHPRRAPGPDASKIFKRGQCVFPQYTVTKKKTFDCTGFKFV